MGPSIVQTVTSGDPDEMIQAKIVKVVILSLSLIQVVVSAKESSK